MPDSETPPLFHGKPVLITYAAELRDPQNIAAGIAATVTHATDLDMDMLTMVDRLVEMGRSLGCLIYVRGYTTEAIEISVAPAGQRS